MVIPSRFEWVGGALPLDFVNTVTWTDSGLVNERLSTYGDLVDWAVEGGAIEAAEGARLQRRAETRGPAGRAALARAHERRRRLHAAFVATARREPLAPADLAGLNQALADATRRLRLEDGAGTYSWMLERKSSDLDGPLYPVIWEAVRLLTSDDRRWLKHCASHDCGWVFLDRSRNHARRWCDMKVCGNNEKARRFYRKQRARAAEPSRQS